jgi:NAD(P)H dehydrogenase (quinone)
MKIAVTTASGGLGSATIQALKQNTSSENIIGIARTPKNAENLGVAIRQGDYDKIATLEKALQGCDVVLVVSSNGEPKNRIQQHRNVIAAAKKCRLSKIVYTSIIGNPKETAFAPVISSNRQTEKDIADSGIPFTIGRNGLYIDPDLEHIAHYKKAGKISNCAGDGKCTYTSRQELGTAYAQLLLNDIHLEQTYNMAGHAITQQQLAEAISHAYGTNLFFEDMSVEAYLKERQIALGDFMGTIIGGIYEGIRNGAFDVPSDFEKIVGRKHHSIDEMIATFKAEKA